MCCLSDGGGTAVGIAPVVGVEEVVGLHTGFARLLAHRASELVCWSRVGAFASFVTRVADCVLQTTALEIVDHEIAGVCAMGNPDNFGTSNPLRKCNGSAQKLRGGGLVFEPTL